MKLQGFIVLDHFDRAVEVAGILGGWMAEGRLTARETVVDGFEELPTALNMKDKAGFEALGCPVDRAAVRRMLPGGR